MALAVFSLAAAFVQEEFVAFVHYPIWWYSQGFLGLLHWVQDGLRYRWRKYALGLWLTHLTTPMYGEYSIWGRVVSFLMRIVMVTGRSIAWIAEALVYALILFVWLVWPLFAALGIAFVILQATIFAR